MKATGIVRRIDDLGRVVIPKEIRRTMKIREGDPLDNSLTPFDRFIFIIAIHSVVKKQKRGKIHLAFSLYIHLSEFICKIQKSPNISSKFSIKKFSL